jgi:excisionase family DNA binding protein
MRTAPTLVNGADQPSLLTKQQAAAYVQCTARFLERMVRSGRLRALKPSRKLVRFRRADLEAFLESGSSMEAWD